MTFAEACHTLGLSRSTLQRRMRAGIIKFTRTGVGKFAPVDITLPEAPPPSEAPLPEAPETPAQLQPEPSSQSEQPDYIAELDEWSTEALKAAIIEWRKPADPLHGIPTNTPAVSSSTMPSPINHKRLLRANAILLERCLVGMKPIYIPRRYSVPKDCADHNSMVSGLGAPEQFEYLWKRKTI